MFIPPTATSINLVERPATAADWLADRDGSSIQQASGFVKIDRHSTGEGWDAGSCRQVGPRRPERSGRPLPGGKIAAVHHPRHRPDGFQNAAGEEYELAVREDTPPTVQIEEPKRSEDRTPVASFDIKAVAEDDYGVVAAQLVARRINDQGGKNTTAKNQWIIDLVKDGQPVISDTTNSWEIVDYNPEHKRYRLAYTLATGAVGRR